MWLKCILPVIYVAYNGKNIWLYCLSKSSREHFHKALKLSILESRDNYAGNFSKKEKVFHYVFKLMLITFLLSWQICLIIN